MKVEILLHESNGFASTRPCGKRPSAAHGTAHPRTGAGRNPDSGRGCGVCRTDLHIIEGELPLHRQPAIPGHEAIGRVIAAVAEETQTMKKEHRNMNIGIIGSGNIGAMAARLFIAAGHSVAISNSRGPETLQSLVAELGAQAHATRVEDAAFSGKIVPDAENYSPPLDGNIPELDADRTASSELLAVHLPEARVIKAFNTIPSQYLATEGNTSLPIDERRAIFVAGDNSCPTARREGQERE